MTDMSIKPAIRSNDISFGLGLMVIAVLISPLIDIFAKLAITTIPSAEITAVRFVLQMIFILPVVLVRGTLFDLTWKKTGLHMLRGGLLVVTMLSFITTLKAMEVADAIAIFFVEPIILTILGSIFLKETIGWRRYTACAVGFSGALLVIQPSMQEVGWIALLPVVSAFGLAVFLLVTRLVAQNEDPWSMQFHAGVWGALFCGILLYFGNGTGSEIFRSGRAGYDRWSLSYRRRRHRHDFRRSRRLCLSCGTRLGAGAAAISGNRFGDDLRLAGVRPSTGCAEMAWHRHHHQLGPLHHLARAPGEQDSQYRAGIAGHLTSFK